VTIQGGPDIHVKARSVVHLKCIISQTVDPPVYVTWFFNNKMLIDFTGADVSLSHSLTVSTSRKIDIENYKSKTKIFSKSNWDKCLILIIFRLRVKSQVHLHFKVVMPDSQQYPWNLYLINKMEDIAVFFKTHNGNKTLFLIYKPW